MKPTTLIQKLERFHYLKEGSVQGYSRQANTVKVRNMICYLLYNEYKMSNTEIADLLNKHHSSVISAKRRLTAKERKEANRLFNKAQNKSIIQRLGEWLIKKGV